MTDEEIISLNRMKLFARSSDLSVVTAKDMNIVVNLVEKQSKEIEELKENLKKKPIFLIKDIYSPKLKEINLQDAEGLIEQGREEVRDKIRAKIEELENEYTGCTTNVFSVLQSLLEEE